MRWFFFVCKQIIAWLARKQQLQEQQERMRQQQEQRLVQEQQQELQQREQQQELLPFYRKQPGQQQRSRLPKRETCSFLKTLSELTKQFPEIA
ncbi:hypothetical protein [Rhodoferax sp. TH121]|uniref:hypothetical protein n=1 Tax=Rhodoferax sp. TH121 TaxID=2022803 RepID=UPI001594FFA4|nr:hypothetical protein [Rhodoferax sp. TH121]